MTPSRMILAYLVVIGWMVPAWVQAYRLLGKHQATSMDMAEAQGHPTFERKAEHYERLKELRASARQLRKRSNQSAMGIIILSTVLITHALTQ